MARQQYPSDREKLKTRPHTKLHHSLHNHRKTAALWGDPLFRGRLAGLFDVATRAYSSRMSGGVLHLNSNDLQFISGRKQSPSALKVVKELLETMEYLYEECDGRLTVWIPKIAKKQGITSAPAGDATRTPSVPEAEAEAEAEADLTTAPPSGGEARQPPKLEGFVRMLKGEIPTGLDGQTWPTPAAWFEDHREILIGEAQAKTGEESGTKFNGAFRSTLMRYWNSKTPKGRNGAAQQGDLLDARRNPITAAVRSIREAAERAERDSGEADAALPAEAGRGSKPQGVPRGDS